MAAGWSAFRAWPRAAEQSHTQLVPPPCSLVSTEQPTRRLPLVDPEFGEGLLHLGMRASREARGGVQQSDARVAGSGAAPRTPSSRVTCCTRPTRSSRAVLCASRSAAASTTRGSTCKGQRELGTPPAAASALGRAAGVAASEAGQMAVGGETGGRAGWAVGGVVGDGECGERPTAGWVTKWAASEAKGVGREGGEGGRRAEARHGRRR